MAEISWPKNPSRKRFAEVSRYSQEVQQTGSRLHALQCSIFNYDNGAIDKVTLLVSMVL